MGWHDSDNDGLSDPIDTIPSLTLIPATPDPTSDRSPLFSGSTEDIPFPPAVSTYEALSINNITTVEFRVNNGAWMQARPSDGVFNSAAEDFEFNPLLCTNGTYTIQVRATNSVGHLSSVASDTISVNSSEPCKATYFAVVYSSNGSFQPEGPPAPPIPPGGYPPPMTPTPPAYP
jgi:hypothetical protein